MTIEIPKKLQNPEFRFCLLKPKSKIPMEEAWQLLEVNYERQEDKSWKNKKTGELYKISKKVNGKKEDVVYYGEIHNYEFNNPKLLRHLERGGNYGVLTGPGNLRVLDADDLEFGKKMLGKFNTFTVRTCGGGYHFYFISDCNENKVFKEGELRCHDMFVVGPGCYVEDERKKHKGDYTLK
jgi:hypothetical protein